MCLNAAISELKVYVFELILLLVLYTLTTRDGRRIAGITPFIIVIVIISVRLMYYLYPYFDGFYSLDVLMKGEASGGLHYHGNPESIGRLHQISGMTPHIIEYAQARKAVGYLVPRLFGVGLGNAEYALTIPTLNSDFYWRYVNTWYYDFTMAFVFTETGFMGLITYVSLFVYMLCNHLRGLLKMRHLECDSRCLGIMMSVIAMCLIIYDVSLRNNYGYLTWVMLAMPYVMEKSRAE